MIYVQTIRAPLADGPALSQLLSSIPYPQSVHRLLVKGYFGRRWAQAEACDYWLACDGKEAACWRILGATAAQVYAIRIRFDHMLSMNPRLQVSRDLICELVSAVAGRCQCTAEERFVVRLPLSDS
jgi:hypothetical protein